MLFSLVLAGGLSVALAAPSRGSAAYATFETHLAPPSFQRIGDAPRDHKFTLTIALTQPRIGELLDAAAAIANPANARYGAHLTKEEADAFSAPDAASVEAVTQWLQSQSLTGEWSDTSDSVAIADVSIAKADQMLDTTYGVFQQQDGSEVYRTESYKLPQFLHEHVDFVHVSLQSDRNRRKLTGVRCTANEYVRPSTRPDERATEAPVRRCTPPFALIRR